jgi:zinc protease
MRHGLGLAGWGVVAVLWLHVVALGQDPLPSVPWDVHEETLGNGLSVLLLRDSRLPVVTFMVWYRVGARNEQLGSTGLAHLLEHLMFRGTQNYGPKVFSHLIQRHGGRHNAFTGQDYTAYFERIATDHVEVAIKLEADRMQHLVVDDEVFKLERQVVQEERRRRVEDQPVAFMWENLRAMAYQAHPYGWPIIGWPTDLQRLTADEARQFYTTYYIPNNAFVVVVGDFEQTATLDMIRKHFAPIPRGPAPPPVQAREPNQHGPRRVTVRRPARLPYFAAAYHVPTYDHADAYALDVMGELLGGTPSSRLVQALQREKQLVLTIEAGYEGLSLDPPLFTVSAQPAPDVKVEEVESAIWAEIDALKQQRPSQVELDRIKQYLNAAYVIRLDSQFYRTMALGQAALARSWTWLIDYLPRLAAVTAEDVQRVARQYLIEENRTVGILQPLPEKKKAAASESKAPLARPGQGGSVP